MNRIKELRKTLGMTQSEFAKRLGVKNTLISRIENDDVPLSSQTRKAILREFHVNSAWLDKGEGDIFYGLSGNPVSLMEFTTDVLQAPKGDVRRTVLEAMAEMDPSDWDKIEAIVDRIASRHEKEK